MSRVNLLPFFMCHLKPYCIKVNINLKPHGLRLVDMLSPLFELNCPGKGTELYSTAAMANLEELWGALRGAGSEELAPTLIRNGVVSLNMLTQKHEELHSAGMTNWQIEAILAAGGSSTAGSESLSSTSNRVDLPVRNMGKRANMPLKQPNPINGNGRC